MHPEATGGGWLEHGSPRNQHTSSASAGPLNRDEQDGVGGMTSEPLVSVVTPVYNDARI